MKQRPALSTVTIILLCFRTLNATELYEVTTIAGSGSAGSTDATGTSAKFKMPTAGVLSKDGNTLYVIDTLNHLIRARV